MVMRIASELGPPGLAAEAPVVVPDQIRHRLAIAEQGVGSDRGACTA